MYQTYLDKVNLDKIIHMVYGKDFINLKTTPDINNVFNAFKLCPFKDLKVVIIGQNPYPQINVATGLAFGNRRDSKVISPSLNVIIEGFKNEFAKDSSNINKNFIFDISLESWANQGVLLLNTALTVEINRIGSHNLIWRSFIIDFLTKLSNGNTGLVYLLLGDNAQAMKKYINPTINWIICKEHPAYYARNKEPFECEVFNEINHILKNYFNTKINWYGRN